MNIHMNAQQITQEPRHGELDLATLKKFIAFSRRSVSHVTSSNILQ